MEINPSSNTPATLSPMPVIAGPCVIEDEGLVLEMAAELKSQLQGLDIDFYFKASFDKANRTSMDSFRGPGLQEGLKVLEKVKSTLGLKLLTDFHSPEQALPVAEIVDFLQVPAFLCRQTDMIVSGALAALKKQRKLNVKKGQFLAPWDVKNIAGKARHAAIEAGIFRTDDWIWMTERGVSFGYNSLVVDMTSFQTIHSFGIHTIFDATHSVQCPGGAGTHTSGKRENIEVLARAAMAAGAQGIFLECHPRPEKAKSDAANAFHLAQVGSFIRQLLKIRSVVSDMPKLLVAHSV